MRILGDAYIHLTPAGAKNAVWERVQDNIPMPWVTHRMEIRYVLSLYVNAQKNAQRVAFYRERITPLVSNGYSCNTFV